MSSSGIGAINSGPLIIRTYGDSSANNTYLLGSYDIPISNNRVLITSTNGLLVPSDAIVISSVTVSTINVESAYISTGTISTLFDNNAYISTAYLSSVFSINSSITVYDPVVLTEDGAQSTLTSANLTVWGISAGDPITVNFTTTTTYTINSTISTIDFQMIGSGGTSTFSNPLISNEDLPGYGTYITGSLKVKQGDSLLFTIGQLGGVGGGSGGTSLIYISTTGLGAISTLVAVAGAGGGNGYSPSLISSSSGGGGGGGGTGSIPIGGATDYIAIGSDGYDGLSTIGGVVQSIVDGGHGGATSGGVGGAGDPTPGSDGITGQNPYPLGTLTNGGIVLGGQGGASPAAAGAWGGGGYSGGGGGGALNSGSLSTSAGGGGGATYIATSTLNGILSNVVCLAGHFLSNNNASPLNVYGTPLNPGFAAISAYSPNDTIYTNGDIECRVLRYELLDPPINAIGGGSAVLWSLYPAIHPLAMNNNSITESGSIEVESGGVDVTGDSVFRNQVSVLQQLNASTISSGSAVFTDPRTSGDGIISINGFSSSNIAPGISIHNGDSNISFFANLNGLSYNPPIVQANDAAIIFKSTINNGALVIAPHNNSIESGLRISSSGTTTIYGTTHASLLSSNTISSGVTYSGVMSSNTISSGIMYSEVLNSNTISSGQIDSALVNGREIKWTTPLTYSAPDPGGGAVIWNTATPGIGQSEFINCRGSGSGGFGFYDVAPLSTLASSVKLVSFDMDSLTVYRSSNTIGLYANLSSGIFTNIVQNNDSAIIFTSSATGGALVIAPTNTVNCGIRISSNCTTTIYGTTITSTLSSGTITANTISSGTVYTTNISIPSGNSLNINAANISTIGNSVVTGNLQVNGDFIHPSVSPPGSIIMYGGATAPSGWVLCDGTLYSSVTYSALFNAIGYTFGQSGTSFRVPDMRNQFVVGVGTGYNRGDQGGNALITLDVSQMPSHTHNMNPYGITGYQLAGGSDPGEKGFVTGILGQTVYSNTQPSGGGLPFDNRPPYIALNYIIKT